MFIISYMKIDLAKILSNLKENEYFVDSYFLPSNTAFDKDLKWLRPHEIDDKAVLGFSSDDYTDVIQGKLDDCALISACCSIANHNFFLKNVK
jgi:hypothetical protein